MEVLLGHGVPVPFSEEDPAHNTASLIAAWSQPQLLPWIPSGYETLRLSDKAGRQKLKKGHFPGPCTAKMTFVAYKTLIVMLTGKQKPNPLKAWYCALPTPRSYLPISVPGSPSQWQHPANLLKVLRCSHSFGEVFLRYSRNLKGNQRLLRQERASKASLLFPPIVIPIASTPALLNIIPSSNQCNLLFQKCLKTPGMVI